MDSGDFQRDFDAKAGEKAPEKICEIFRAAFLTIETTKVWELVNDMITSRPESKIVQVPKSTYDEVFSECLTKFSNRAISLFNALETLVSSGSCSNWNSVLKNSHEFLAVTAQTQKSIIDLFHQANSFQKLGEDDLISIPLKRFCKLISELDRLIELWRILIGAYQDRLDVSLRDTSTEYLHLDINYMEEIKSVTQKCIDTVNTVKIMTGKSKYDYFLREIRRAQESFEMCIRLIRVLMAQIELSWSNQVQAPQFQYGQIVPRENLGINNDEDHKLPEDETTWYKLSLRLLVLLRLWTRKVTYPDHHQFNVFKELSNSQYETLIDELGDWINYSSYLRITFRRPSADSPKKEVQNIFIELQGSFERAYQVFIPRGPSNYESNLADKLEEQTIPPSPKEIEKPSKIVDRAFHDEEREREWIQCCLNQLKLLKECVDSTG